MASDAELERLQRELWALERPRDRFSFNSREARPSRERVAQKVEQLKQAREAVKEREAFLEYRRRNPPELSPGSPGGREEFMRERAAASSRAEAARIDSAARKMMGAERMALMDELGFENYAKELPPEKAALRERLQAAFDKAMKRAGKMAPKALATGVAAKMMLGGAAKAAAIPGIAEGLELMGREEPTAQEFYRGQGDAIAEALGLATGYEEPSPVYDPRREAAIRASLRSGREGLRPAPGETPVTAGEIEAYRRRR